MGNSRLRNVINSYSTVTKTEKRTYENNRFPEVNFPSGGNVNSMNTVPTQISTTTTTTSEENRNTITAQDVALKAASERHQNAVKAITNLLTIIDQARANRNYAKSKLESYVEAYNDALAAQRRAQNEIIAAETKRTQIISAIEGVEAKIKVLKAEIDALEKDRDEYRAKKAELVSMIAGEEKMKAELLAQL